MKSTNVIIVQLNHHDGTSSVVNLSPSTRLQDLSLCYAVDSVEILSVADIASMH